MRRFSPRRPPWWPDDAPWPPSPPPHMRAWRQTRHRFFLRAAGLLAALFVFTIGGCALALWIAFVALGALKLPSGAVPFLLVGSFVMALLGFTLSARAFRRVAMPIGDLMEAAGRVEGGDYSVRVPERGPREMRALARAFNAMTARLQADEEQRRSLLADVTHELRTPLTIIQGNLEGLMDGVYPRDDEHLRPILEEAQVMSRLIEDLRTLALVESGALKLQREPTDIGVLVSEAGASFRAQADAAGVELRVDAAPDLPLLEIDPLRIREVLTNLIANALRYTPRGGRIQIAAAMNSDRRVAVSVSDTGTGIPADALPYLFDRFYKSSDSRGTGLGLAIAKNLVTAHGGEIHAASEGGRGATIHFTLPLQSV